MSAEQTKTFFDRQAIFNRSVRHLRKQGRRAMQQGKDKLNGRLVARCRYRTQDGLTCAIGGLFPNELYDPVMDDKDKLHTERTGVMLGMSVGELFKAFPSVIEPVSGVKGPLDAADLNFLGSLQHMHDDAKDNNLEAAFQSFAQNFGLVVEA